jgi:hypothetical protein
MCLEIAGGLMENGDRGRTLGQTAQNGSPRAV